MRLGLSGGYDADSFGSLGVDHDDDDAQNAARNAKAILPIILAIVVLDDSPGIIEHAPRVGEVDLVLADVGLGLRVVPLERVITHQAMAAIRNVNNGPYRYAH